MSAHKQQRSLKHLCSFDTDHVMDESGYLSFQALHNSTASAPFYLFDADSESENCRNAANSTQITHNTKTDYRTPGSQTFWGQTPADTDVELVSPQRNKRRKPQLLPPHSSPKKSKKQLFPVAERHCRTKYYNGLEKLDIVGMLSNTLPALECILQHLDARMLDLMTRVSTRWAQAVYKCKQPQERLHQYRYKQSLSKENWQAAKRACMLNKITKNLVPLRAFNAITPNQTPQHMSSQQQLEEQQSLVEQIQRIKCPRCGKASKVYCSQAPASAAACWTPQPTALSQTLPHQFSYSAPVQKAPALLRFHSLDQLKPERAQKFGECTSFACKFRFCLHCCCAPHPGSKCLVSELGTPSKLLQPAEREQLTPPKRSQKKIDSKLIRKNSLKRLNF
ncbi:uncharacterized protein LOC108603942 [Drosophila busckii]|uniref:uncharacterized protein LOC108603942 n=1 Tax=Drosophila busckii TaxID=30019 RepID=UPI00083F1DB0|nr:uncharacterized protein LOC108603942 [Drosophila busckii]